ncbi:ABC transporter permease subunit [Streptomyces sp. NEAU-S7GS2]|uniref:ABC transporter permease subunit n=1 Tax=Streptomyces sp. NEAU-S7GS2 TaxID=2202000 RepID=UPI0019525D5F|nr:ABC transporter permease subunit [Streptomyces sp. NEAU-S7GS2]
MTSPQQPQPQPQPEPGPHDTGAQEQPAPAAPPMTPAAPQGMPPQTPPAQQQPGQQPAPEQPAPAKEAGTMMLQAQGQPPAQGQAPQAQAPAQGGQAPAPAQGQEPAQPAPAREAGTMMLQAQQYPEPQPLAAHGPGKEAGTMMLQAQAPAQAPAQPQAQQPQNQPQQPPAQPHPQQSFAGAGGYVSSIPVRPTHLGHALLSEWTKIRSVRSTMWTLGVMVLLTVGIGLLTGAVIAGHSDSLGPESPLNYGTFGMMMGLIPLITLGVLVISSEYSTGMIRTTLTASPARARVLTAKAIVFFALSFVVTLVTTTVVAVAQYSMLSDMAKSAPTGAEWFKATVGVSLFTAMIGLLSLAVGALLRHSAGAITLMVGVYLLPLVLAIFMQAESLKDIQTWLLEYALPSQLNVMYDVALTSSGPSGWEPLWIVTGLAAVTLGSAYAVIHKRDV